MDRCSAPEDAAASPVLIRAAPEEPAVDVPLLMATSPVPEPAPLFADPSTTDPVVCFALPPDCNRREPPAPVSELPAETETAPPLPVPLPSQTLTVISPAGASDEAPLTRLTFPERPTDAASPVPRERLPEVPALAAPEASSTLPPLPISVLDPARRVSSPSAPAPLPLASRVAPPASLVVPAAPAESCT